MNLGFMIDINKLEEEYGNKENSKNSQMTPLHGLQSLLLALAKSSSLLLAISLCLLSFHVCYHYSYPFNPINPSLG